MKKVFISHSSKDAPFIEAELLPLLRQNGITPWYSKADIKSASLWERMIRDALNESNWVLVVLSPDSVSSDWVSAEIHLAFEIKRGRVIPLLCKPCNPGDLHLKLIPIQHIDYYSDPSEARRRLIATICGNSKADHAGIPAPAAVETGTETIRRLEPGTRIKQYSIEKEILADDIGGLLLARNIGTNQNVTLRLFRLEDIPGTLAGDFVREATIIHPLHHPSILQMYDSFDFGGYYCLVMASLEGSRPLSDILLTEHLDPDHCATLVAEIAAAVGFIYERSQLCHADVQANRVFVTPDGHPMLLGFENQIIGFKASSMASYFSPDNIRGERFDSRTDIWCLGVLLYQMLTGVDPLAEWRGQARTHLIAQQLPTAPSIKNPSVPEALDTICMKCLALRREHRFQSAMDLSHALSNWRMPAEPAPRVPEEPIRRNFWQKLLPFLNRQ